VPNPFGDQLTPDQLNQVNALRGHATYQRPDVQHQMGLGPMFGGGMTAFLNALHMGQGPMMHGQPIPGAPNTQFPLNPGAGGPIQGQQMPAQPMIGSSLSVTGATPATSPFGLPHY
jgi:hypothetical protein